MMMPRHWRKRRWMLSYLPQPRKHPSPFPPMSWHHHYFAGLLQSWINQYLIRFTLQTSLILFLYIADHPILRNPVSLSRVWPQDPYFYSNSSILASRLAFSSIICFSFVFSTSTSANF